MCKQCESVKVYLYTKYEGKRNIEGAELLDEFLVFRVLAKVEGSEGLTLLVRVWTSAEITGLSLDRDSQIVSSLSFAVRRYFYSNVAAGTGGIDWWMLMNTGWFRVEIRGWMSKIKI